MSVNESQTPGQRASQKARFESLGLLLLSLATVGTAWCSYQAATWGGVSQRLMNLSAAASRRAAADELRAAQMALLDVLLFSQHINARSGSNEPLARFYADRFRGEAKTAFEAWQATLPFQNPDAPPHPFVTNLYHPKLLQNVAQAQDDALRNWEQSGEAGRTSRGYVLITVLLASALFCGGTAAKFETPKIRHSVLVLGLAAFGFAVVRLWSLPIQL